jgi:RNA polymerase sigma-70 factor (ECF subfamily)
LSDQLSDLVIHSGLLAQAATDTPAKDCPLEREVLGHFEESRGSLLRYLYSLGLLDHDAEEVIQEVFLALFQHLRQGRPRDNLRGWLFRVAHNLGLKRRMAVRRWATPANDELFQTTIDPNPNPEQQLSTQQRRAKLIAVFEALPEQDRCCLQMRAEGLRYREIAGALGISLGSVANSLARSLKKLHKVDGRF